MTAPKSWRPAGLQYVSQKTRHAGNLRQFRAAGKGRGPGHAITLAPLLARQALGRRSFTPIRPHVRAYHAALGASSSHFGEERDVGGATD